MQYSELTPFRYAESRLDIALSAHVAKTIVDAENLPSDCDIKWRLELDGRLAFWRQRRPYLSTVPVSHICENEAVECNPPVSPLPVSKPAEVAPEAVPFSIAEVARDYRITANGRRKLSCCGAILDEFPKRWVCMVTLTYKKPPDRFKADFAHAFVKALNRFIQWWRRRLEARSRAIAASEVARSRAIRGISGVASPSYEVAQTACSHAPPRRNY